MALLCVSRGRAPAALRSSRVRLVVPSVQGFLRSLLAFPVFSAGKNNPNNVGWQEPTVPIKLLPRDRPGSLAGASSQLLSPTCGP